jgi:predicted AAA+ superfamily ATPase
VGFSTSPNNGRLAENMVAITLEKRRLQGAVRYFFWKNTRHEEVDFVCMENNRISCCIQVSWNIDNPKTADRFVGALCFGTSRFVSLQKLLFRIALEKNLSKPYNLRYTYISDLYKFDVG